MIALAPAPRFPVDEHGAPAYGGFIGEVERVDWDALTGSHRRGRIWRALHHKRWHYVSIAGPRVILACCIVDAGYAANAFGYLFDRAAGKLVVDFGAMGLPGASQVADRPGESARSTFAGRGASLTLERPAGSPVWNLRARGPGGFTVDAILDATAAAPTFCGIAPIDGGVANCTHKTVCLPARGTASAGGEVYALDGHTAALDHTSGLLARDTRWRWASGAGPRLAINLVEGFNGPVENVAWIDGRIVPIGPVTFTFDRERTTDPWHIQSDTLDLTFTPEGERRQDKNLVVAVSRYVQPIGSFSGVIRPIGGAEVKVDALPGVTEDHIARW